MGKDDDAPKTVRVARPAPAEDRPKRSRNAEAAARYRARKRGEDVPKKRPGPARTTESDLRERVRELEAEVARLKALVRVAQQHSRDRVTTVEQTARSLLEALKRQDPRRDSPERRVLLGDVVAEIEDRHEHWPER